jgi:hypothetical protein
MGMTSLWASNRVGAFYDAPTADMKRRDGDSTDRGTRPSSHARVPEVALGTQEVSAVQRLIEQPADEGDVLEGGWPLGRVHYHLSVYHPFSELEGESVPVAIEVEGLIVPRNGIEVADLWRRHADLTLRLADGRSLDFSIVDANGAVRSTGRGLFRE